MVQYYLNHFYLITIVSFLLFFLPADSAFSVKNRSFNGTVRQWHVMVLQCEIALVYFYAGVVKFNEDWLRGEPLKHWVNFSSGCKQRVCARACVISL